MPIYSIKKGAWLVLTAIFVASFILAHTNVLAQTNDDGFSIQVAPSPLFVTVIPGEPKTVELNIRNNGTITEDLIIEPRNFDVNNQTNEVNLKDTVTDDIKNMVVIAQPTFSVAPGQWYTQRITLDVQKSAGFSYWFALNISRQNDNPANSAGQTIKGSVAVFTLINVDYAGASRQITLAEFISEKRVYEYLPAKFIVTLKNGGNTILQPYGNIFIQRKSSDKTPIAVLPINKDGSYILPGVTRSLEVEWSNGFPFYELVKNADNSLPKNKLNWDTGNLKNFRIGKYTAKLVAVYNDGVRDVPLEAQLTFWIVPWKLLLIPLTIILVIGIGLWTIIRKTTRLFKRRKKYENPKGS